ncbi:AMIN domain-containing protein [Nostoc sp.]
MKPQKSNYFFWQSLLLTTSVMVSINKPSCVVATPIVAAEIPVSNQQLLPQQRTIKPVVPIREIRSLDQIEHPLTDAQKLVQLPTPTDQTGTISVTGVKVNSTDKGLEVILETGVKSDRLQVTTKTEGKSYVVDILNAKLRLTSGNTALPPAMRYAHSLKS